MSKTPLFVYDVHFSDHHEEEAKQKDRANRASLVLTRFADRIDSAFEGEDLLYSVCDSTTCVIFQCELGKVVMTIDFLNNDIRFEKDEKPLAISDLRANLADSAAQKVTRMSGILTSVSSAFSAPSDFRAKASALAEICAQFAKEPAQTANRNPAR